MPFCRMVGLARFRRAVGSPRRGHRAAGVDAGNAIVEFVWLAILLLVPLTYLVLTAFQLQRAAFAVAAATRAAGRAYVTTPAGGDPGGRACAAARLAVADQGLALPAGCGPEFSAACDGGCCTPGAQVHVHLRVTVVLTGFAALKVHGADVPVDGRHDEPVDRYAVPPGSGC